MKKRVLSLSLALLLALALLPVHAVGGTVQNVAEVTIGGVSTPYPSFASAWNIAAAAESTEAQPVTVKLLANVAAAPDESSGTYRTSFGSGAGFEERGAILVPRGKHIVLDLFGYSLDRGLTGHGGVTAGHVLKIEGALTLRDSSTALVAEQGMITGGNSYYIGGAIRMDNGSLTMTGGRITGNSSGTQNNGAIYPYNSTLILLGGSITGNRAGGGGAIGVETGRLIVGGAMTIDENYTDYYTMYGEIDPSREAQECNVWLGRGSVIEVRSGFSGAVSFTTGQRPGLCNPIAFATGEEAYPLTVADLARFAWDQNGEGVALRLDSAANTLYLDAGYTDWYSAEQDNFVLTTAAQLRELARIVNEESDDFYGKTVTLGADIDLGGAAWVPIGARNAPAFRGTFDGGGHAVTNMAVTLAESGDLYGGLFGATEGAVVRNVRVSGSVDIRTGNGMAHAGGLIGHAENTHIEACRFDGTVHSEGDVSAYAGGIAGRLRKDRYEKTIVSCCATGSVFGASGSATAYVGGIAGGINNDEVKNCYTRCTVTKGGEGDFAGHLYGGGRSVTICNSYFVSADESAAEYWDGAGNLAEGTTPAQVRALGDTLNAWVETENADPGNVESEVSYLPWYTSGAYNDGYPCFQPYIAPPINRHTITAAAGAGGTISRAGRLSVAEGAAQRFAVTPDGGHRVYAILVDGVNVGTGPEYTLENVRADHSVVALFAAEFSDVGADWFAPGVDYVSAYGLMEGVGGSRFAPALETTRGMIVTILWRLEGEPAATEALPFTDVPADHACYEAVAWAAEHEIALGFSATEFRPDQAITREQLAAILWRFAQYRQDDVRVGEETNILSYDDALTISAYAFPALQWTCGAGLMQGSAGALRPRDFATRAETAVLLHRFCAAG